MLKFRPLNADEVECRIGSKFESQGAVSLLLYKTSRTDMALLDETVGPENWQTEYVEVHGNLFCKLSIKFGNEWITKMDCGIESKQDDGNEKKAESSDALKRCGFLFGIARELYTSPFIYIRGLEFEGKAIKYKGERFYPVVSEFEVTDGKISYLVITNNGKEVIYHFGKSKNLDDVIAKKLAEAERVN